MRAARARLGIGAASLPRKVFHEEIRWQRFLIVREELDRSRLFTAREEKVHGLLCGFQVSRERQLQAGTGSHHDVAEI